MKKQLTRTRILAFLLAVCTLTACYMLTACNKTPKDGVSEPLPEENIPTAEYRLPAKMTLRHREEKDTFEVQYSGDCMTITGSDGSKLTVEVDKHGRPLEEAYRYDDGKFRYHRKYEYDERGNVTAQIEYDEDGNEKYRLLHTYDGDGTLLKTVNTDSGRWLSSRSTHEYDASGREIKETNYDLLGNVSHIVESVYDERGNLLQETVYDENGNRTSRKEYEYDENGNRTKYVRKSGPDTYVYLYTYDENGNETEEAFYDGDDVLKSRREWKYAPDGTLREIADYDGDGVLQSRQESEYTSDGLPQREAYYSGETLVWQSEWKYDGHGNPTEGVLLSYNPDGTLETNVSRIQYEYDNNGRIAVRIESDEDGAVMFHDEYTYDEAGHEIKRTSTDGDGNFLNETVNAYDAAGHKTLYMSRGISLGEELIEREEWIYDENGWLVQVDDYHTLGEKVHRQTVYTDHDGNGNAGQILQYRFFDVDASTEYTYDEGGRLLRRVASDAEGVLREREEREYDADGRESRQTIYYEIRGISAVYESTYDERGIQTKRYILPDGTARELYEYDAEGKMLKRIQYSPHDGNVEASYEYEYNADGKPVKEITMQRYGSFCSYTITLYEYDETGKCINRDQYASDNPDSYEDNRISHRFYQYDEQGWMQSALGENYSYTVTERSSAILTEAQFERFLVYISEFIAAKE